MSDENEAISLESFRGGTEFVPKKPDADGVVAIIDVLDGPKGTLFKLVAYQVLKRSFADAAIKVTMKEVGRMEFEDYGPLIQIGLSAIESIDEMGFRNG